MNIEKFKKKKKNKNTTFTRDRRTRERGFLDKLYERERETGPSLPTRERQA